MAANVNEIQHIVLTSVGAAVNVSVDSPRSAAPITFAASSNAAAVQAALLGLGFIGVGDVLVTGTPTLSGNTAQVQRVTLASTPGSFTVAGTTIALGDSSSSIQTALRLVGGALSDVTVSGNAPSASGGTQKTIRLTAASVTGAATFGGATVTPGDTAATVQAALRGQGGNLIGCLVTDASDPGVPSATGGYIVSGAGTAGYNGTYVPAGTHNGFEYYQLDSGHFLSFDSGDNIYQLHATLSNADNVGYIYNFATGGTVPLTGWTSNGADDPAPTLSAAAGSASGYYDIQLTLSAANATFALSGTGWSQSVQVTYVAPLASGHFDLQFTYARGNVALETVTGTGVTIAVQTAYAAGAYSGTFVVTFRGNLAGEDIDLLTTTTSGVAITVSTQGGDLSEWPNPLTDDGNFPSHDNGASTSTGWRARCRCAYSKDPTAALTVVFKQSATNAFGGEETDLCTFDDFSDKGVQTIFSDTPTDTVLRYVRAYYLVTGGSSPEFIIIPTLSRKGATS